MRSLSDEINILKDFHQADGYLQIMGKQYEPSFFYKSSYWGLYAFELDFVDGEIRYKTSIDVENSTLSFPQIKQLVYTNVMMMDEYLPGIMSVIDGGVEAREAIAQIES